MSLNIQREPANNKSPVIYIGGITLPKIENSSIGKNFLVVNAPILKITNTNSGNYNYLSNNNN